MKFQIMNYFKKYRILFLLSLLLAPFCSHSQAIDWDAVRDAYAEKYQPAQIPAWLFPMIFEEGTGQRDTIYLGYDPSATAILTWDPEFAEEYIIVDPSKFHAFWSSCCDGVHDTILTVNIGGDNGIGGPIRFINGILPLKMYWDRWAFYDSVLPFPDQSPAPRAQGRLAFEYPSGAWIDSTYTDWCAFDFPVLLTDTFTSFNSMCNMADFVEFFDIHGNTNTPLAYLNLEIEPWTGFLTGIQEPLSAWLDDFVVCPNPSSSWIRIESASGNLFNYQMYGTADGRLTGESESLRSYHTIDARQLLPGLYFIKITTNNVTLIYKSIIISK
jgi:hypothetical protein